MHVNRSFNLFLWNSSQENYNQITTRLIGYSYMEYKVYGKPEAGGVMLELCLKQPAKGAGRPAR